MGSPRLVFINILAGRAPLFFILRLMLACSPKITSPKSIIGSATSSKAFLHVQIKGTLIGPVSASKGSTEFMS